MYSSNINKFSKEHQTIKWVSASWGTPSKEVSKVLMRMQDGFVEEGSYNRRLKTWVRTDGTKIEGVTHWALLPDSVVQQTI